MVSGSLAINPNVKTQLTPNKQIPQQFDFSNKGKGPQVFKFPQQYPLLNEIELKLSDKEETSGVYASSAVY
jgi:hypothetical protein